jgi:hypothetical protein
MPDLIFSDSSQELFQTAKGVASQCDITDRIHIRFGDVQADFRIHEFLNFRRAINSIDIKSKLFNLSDDCDFQYLESPRQTFTRHFSLCELIQIRELVNGAHFALELNSIIREALYSNFSPASR